MSSLPPGFALLPGWLAASEAAELFELLQEQTPWEQHRFRIFGREVDMPRRIAMYGPVGYRYSGVEHPPRPLTPVLADLAARLSGEVGEALDSVLLNLYRHGRDAVSWHHDDDYGQGPEPVIASLSLGATRRFHLRSRQPPRRSHSVDLVHGSLLVMSGASQRLWVHRIARTRRPVGARINLTFRRMLPSRDSID